MSKIPFTMEQFLQVFEKYNQAIYPFQFALILVAISAVFLAASRKPFAIRPTFGASCPTAIFTFGLLLWTDKRFPLSLLIIPVLCSLIGTSAVLSFGIKEDFGLLVTRTISTIVVGHNLLPKMEKV